ncbi:MAG: hypothetical protein JO154_04885 [Chitinophaga sp.]|uniref:hypothetical protein n=1 Tax=Chitinophaga sp. TaxID=1869181 RepID=UPI0025B88B7F|nr:hypothetical protein [Chitinophaga sp.]MBV8251924.1 hypothetical protein [Chitinophaga sp.]
MGSYNTLHTAITCPDCKQHHDAAIQFKYGLTWQLHYHLGDSIRWRGIYDIGNPTFRKVKVYGIIESTTCPACGMENIPEDYDILVTDNVMMDVAPIPNALEYVSDLSDGRFIHME